MYFYFTPGLSTSLMYFLQLSFSPNTPASSHAKIILLLSVILLSCAGLFMVCAVVGWQYGFNHFTFLYSEVFILFARTLHSVIKYMSTRVGGGGVIKSIKKPNSSCY